MIIYEQRVTWKLEDEDNGGWRTEDNRDCVEAGEQRTTGTVWRLENRGQQELCECWRTEDNKDSVDAGE